MRKRDTEIDVAKGIGILLVVACHANFAPLSPGRFFHMPLFFFLTGYLSSFEAGLGKMIGRKLRSLYVPFVVTELLLVCTNPLWVSMGISTPSQMSLGEQLQHIVLFDNISLLVAPIWFLTVLFAVNLLVWGWVNWSRQNGARPGIFLYAQLVCSLLLCVWGMHQTLVGGWRNEWSYNLPEGLNVLLVAQFFCLLGYAVRRMDWKATIGWLACVALVWLYVAKLLLGLAVDMRANHYSSWWRFLPTALAGIYATMYVAGRVTKLETRWSNGLKSALAYSGEASLYILLLHIFCFKLVGYMQVQCLGMTLDNSGWINPGCTGAWTIVYTMVGLVVPLGVYALVASGKAQYAAYRARKKAIAGIAEKGGDQ